MVVRPFLFTNIMHRLFICPSNCNCIEYTYLFLLHLNVIVSLILDSALRSCMCASVNESTGPWQDDDSSLYYNHSNE